MELLNGLPTWLQAFAVVAIFAGASVGGLYLVRRRVAPNILRDDHDVAGFTFGVVGAFYGVVLAFVIVAVWQRYERANAKAQQESLAVVNLYYLSKGFDEPVRTELQNALRSYAEGVVNLEWGEMARKRYHRTINDERHLWDLLLTYSPTQPRQQIFLNKSIDQMAQLSDARRQRFMYYNENLPSVVWIIIYVGCIITIGFGYFFGTRLFRSQAIMCGTFASLIGLTILAISELANPYQGRVTISDDAFRFALRTMNAEVHRAAPLPPPVSRRKSRSPRSPAFG